MKRARPALSQARRTSPGAAACRWAPFAAALALAWSIRHSLPGVAVADDYAFLDRLRFQHPLDPLDSMGAAYYWRPFSRQLWYSLVGPWLLQAPWLAAGLSAALLATLSILLHRLTRRLAPEPAWLAPLVATAPLVVESARALIVWPSGAQHLLAAAGATWALHEAAFGRRVTAALAALVAVLSHELAALALPILPVVATRAAGARRGPWVAHAAGVLVLWIAGYLLAMRHGVLLPPSAGPAALAHVPETIVRVFLATVGAEEAVPTAFLPIVVAGIVLTTGALIGILRRRGRDPAATMLAISLVATLPLAALWWDWNAWRAFFPVVGLGIGLTLALARHGALWGAGPVALQLVALIFAEPAGSPTILSPFTASEVSYRRLARMQHVVDATRRLVEREAGRLPQGAAIRFWDLPRGTLVGFEGEMAPRVWLRDRTATFRGFDPPTDPRHLPHLVIAYNAGVARPPVVITRGALETIARALAIMETDPARSDSLNAAAILAQSPPAAPLTIAATRARVLIALNQGRVADARRLADQAAAIEGPTPNTLAFDGAVAISEGRMAEAERLLSEALRQDPRNSIAAQGMANLNRRLGAGSR